MLKDILEMKKILAEQLNDPSDEFVSFLYKKINPNGRLTRNVMDKFTEITKTAFNQFIKEKVDERLVIALHGNNGEKESENDVTIPSNSPFTSEEEWEGYYIVKSILSELVDPERVTIRDRISYCTVLLDNNQNRVICRMHFNSKQKHLGFFDKNEKHIGGTKKEDKIPIHTVSEIYKHAERLRKTAKIYI